MQAQSQTSDAAQTFHGFPLLPAELRLMVWNHAVRVSPAPHILPRGPIPSEALLETSYESRAAFLSVFTSCFLPMMHTALFPDGPISLYGDLKRDIFYINVELDSAKIFSEKIDKWLAPEARGVNGIKHIAVETAYWEDQGDENTPRILDTSAELSLILREFEGVKKLTLVLDDSAATIGRNYYLPLGESKLLECEVLEQTDQSDHEGFDTIHIGNVFKQRADVNFGYVEFAYDSDDE